MSKLLIKPSGTEGRVLHVTPQSAGWTYVGFELVKLAPGAATSGGEATQEACLVLVTGRARITVDGQDFGSLGGRTSPFEGLPTSVYAPAGAQWQVVAETPVELAICLAPGTPGARPPRLIGPQHLKQETRGKGSNTRHVVNILPETEPACSLLVVEVITPAGHASSYPPHKHDTDALPDESLLEEVYYHRINPPQGFAFQRVYTDDGEIDETMTLTDGSLTLVPRGYHPCAALHGYDLYYLNVMAGPKRTWKIHNAVEHEWLLKA
jgi:5-deoxy-glucuronate isomerase